ncbi:MAG: hypothetical protein PHE27_06830 [Alphaproteobacteria bacterium]|nr:hypothetical protein [Alphaproteobacteria bacterium]
MSQAKDISSEENKAPETDMPTTAAKSLIKTEPGQAIEGKGIYLGAIESGDKKFAVYAAPEDLKNAADQKVELAFKDAAYQVAHLRNWHGHDGACLHYTEENPIDRAVKCGDIGKWFIPPTELMVCGGRPETMFNLKDTDAFKGTFTTEGEKDETNYLASNYRAYWVERSWEWEPKGALIAMPAEGDMVKTESFFYVSMKDGRIHTSETPNRAMKIRPIRLEVLQP